MQLSDRIRTIRKARGWSQAALAERLKMTSLTSTRWESGERKPDFVALLAFAAVTGASISWLENEEGPMWADGENRQASMDEIFLDRPLIAGAATCGPGGEVQDPGPDSSRYALRHDFATRILQRCGGGKEEDLFFLLCRGESMAPTILDKEIVLLNAALKIRMEPKNNGIYLVRRCPEDSEARVKRCRLDKAKGQLVLASDNRSYPTVTIDLEGAPLHQLILGRVAWVGRYLLETDPPEEDW
jgi:transcriptional regulator with XRE-family HTH domain